MKSGIIIAITFVLIGGITFVYADPLENLNKAIVSEGTEYQISDVIEIRQWKNSPITKIHGVTTTGDMFFIFSNEKTNFIKVMLFGTDGNWHKAKLQKKIVDTSKSEISVVKKNTLFHYLLDQSERVYTKSEYKLFVKTFDKSIYSGNDFQNFQGTISGAKVSTIITDPNGVIKTDFDGIVVNGIYEGVVYVPENLWQKGWYIADILIEFEGTSYSEQLSFYVYGFTQPSGGGCPGGTIRDITGACV